MVSFVSDSWESVMANWHQQQCGVKPKGCRNLWTVVIDPPNKMMYCLLYQTELYANAEAEKRGGYVIPPNNI